MTNDSSLRRDLFLARSHGYVITEAGGQFEFCSRSQGVVSRLNRSAFAIWTCCDGHITLGLISALLRDRFPAGAWNTDDVHEVIAELIANGLVQEQHDSADAPPLIRVGFLGFPNFFNPDVSFFAWMTASHASVLLCDPLQESIDFVFVAGRRQSKAIISNLESVPAGIRVLVHFDGQFDPDAWDFSYTTDVAYSGARDDVRVLPAWTLGIDWSDQGSDAEYVPLRQLGDDRSQKILPGKEPAWALVWSGNDLQSGTVSLLTQKFGSPLCEIQAGNRMNDHCADYRERLSRCRFVIILNDDLDPVNHHILPLVHTAGAIPVLLGSTSCLSGLNARSVVVVPPALPGEELLLLLDTLVHDDTLYQRLLATPLFVGNRPPLRFTLDEAAKEFWNVVFDEQLSQPPSPPLRRKSGPEAPTLTIGMATYDDYDGVYFTIQALRAYHAEVMDQVEFVVVDNKPGSAVSQALQKLQGWIPELRYVPNPFVGGTAPTRDLVFQVARGDYVLCVDSHVLIEAGAVARLLDYFAANPETPDLLQGPLVNDDLKTISSHFSPVWRRGMYGIWCNDERALDVSGEPFDIPMQGLGLFACRKQAWPGFNPEFRGFGGEEGYIHEKFRQRGGRTLCLPFLRWIHRFERPMGIPYRNDWGERIRNYLIGFKDLGLDTQPVLDHFATFLDVELVENVQHQVDVELSSPFRNFDAFYAIDLNLDRDAWDVRMTKLGQLGLAARARYVRDEGKAGSIATAWLRNLHSVITDAKRANFETILVADSDVVFREDAGEIVSHIFENGHVDEWTVQQLDVSDNGPGDASRSPVQLDHDLFVPGALAIKRSVFDELLTMLDDIDPDSDPGSGISKIAYKFSHQIQHLPSICEFPAILASRPRFNEAASWLM